MSKVSIRCPALEPLEFNLSEYVLFLLLTRWFYFKICLVCYILGKFHHGSFKCFHPDYCVLQIHVTTFIKRLHIASCYPDSMLLSKLHLLSKWILSGNVLIRHYWMQPTHFEGQNINFALRKFTRRLKARDTLPDISIGFSNRQNH